MHFPLVPVKSFVQSPGIFFGGDLFRRDIIICFLVLEDKIEILVIDIKLCIKFIISSLYLLLVCHLFLLLIKVRELLLRSIWLLEFLAWMIELCIWLLLPILSSKILISLDFGLETLRTDLRSELCSSLLDILVPFSLLSLGSLLVFLFDEPLIQLLLHSAIDLLRISKEGYLRSLGRIILVLIWNDVSDGAVNLPFNTLGLLNVVVDVVGDDLLAGLHWALLSLLHLVDLGQS
jgi:hypothetical protein